MNGHGESDEPIVPAKAAKAGEDAQAVPQGTSFWELFELVKRLEGRGSAKENSLSKRPRKRWPRLGQRPRRPLSPLQRC